jgi:hypothetical protein
MFDGYEVVQWGNVRLEGNQQDNLDLYTRGQQERRWKVSLAQEEQDSTNNCWWSVRCRICSSEASRLWLAVRTRVQGAKTGMGILSRQAQGREKSNIKQQLQTQACKPSTRTSVAENNTTVF